MNTPATYLQKCDKANPEEHTKEYLMYNYGIEASKFEARLVESLDEIKSFHQTTLKTLLGMIEEMVENKNHSYNTTDTQSPFNIGYRHAKDDILHDLKIIKNSLEK